MGLGHRIEKGSQVHELSWRSVIITLNHFKPQVTVRNTFSFQCTHMNTQVNCCYVVFTLTEWDVVYSLLFSFALNGILVGSDPWMDSGEDKLHIPSLLLHTVHCDHYHCPLYCITELIALTGILKAFFLLNFHSHRYLECASEHLGEGLASHDLLV